MESLLTKYGQRELLIATALAGAAAVAFASLARWQSWLWLGPLIVVAALWLWVLWFFRDPPRQGPDDDDLFLSPADGRVTDITQLGPDSPLAADGVQVGIFMNVLNVHVNRSPCDGVVRVVDHRPGSFLDARNAEASFRNESTTIVMTHTRDGRAWPVVVRQVAGVIARRIVTDLAEGQHVRRGQRIGMIKFGSRLELMVPRELVGEVRVVVGQKVAAGRSVLIAVPKEPGHGPQRPL